MNVPEFVSSINNNNIAGAFAKTWDILDRFSHPVCSISGGSDSDIVLDIIHKLDTEHKVRYIWNNTGLEYHATKEHLCELERKYGINIERVHSGLPVSAVVKNFGYPFVSKIVSAYIHSLQINGFHFSERSYEDDLRDYPKCKSAIIWWHSKSNYQTFNISRHKYLREFLIAHPPGFSISDKCCEYSKKKPSREFFREANCDLSIIGTRKLEGGIRQAHNSCFSFNNKHDFAFFRPIFWFSEQDKREYCRIFGVKHSACYTRYGLKRTGCAGCPFNKHVFSDLDLVREHESMLVKAAENIFAPSYDYTKQFLAFKNGLGDENFIFG